MDIVPDAVMYLADGASDEGEVGEVCAIVTLVIVFGHIIAILHDFHRLVGARYLASYLHRKARLHFALHERALAQLEANVVEEFLLYDLSRGGIDFDGFQMPDVLRDKPLYGEDWDLFSGAPVDLLTLGPVIEPGSGGKIDRFADV